MDYEFEELKRRREERRAGKTRKRGKKWHKLVLPLSIIATCCLLGALVIPKLLPVAQNLWEDLTSTEPSTEPLPTEPDKVIHLVAGGDVNVSDQILAAGQTGGGYNFTEVFKDVLPILSDGDVSVMNFEGIISGDVYGSETKAAPPQLLQSLASAGVDILQTANSCSVYDGLQSLKSTLQGVKAAGMTPVGTFADKEEFEKSGGYLLWEINGIKVAFVAFTKGMNGSGLPVSGEGCVNLLYKDYTSNQEDYSTIYQKVDKDGITKVLRNAAAQNPDVTIALLHWGSDSVDQISKTQTQICKLMQEEGVDAIIGTHSHFLQKMEYDPENGTFVAYSLGDFLGDFRQATDHSGTNYSVLLNLEITKSGTTGETKITGYDCVPIYREERDGKLRILRIREAMEGYESNFLGRVSEETYNAMKSAMTQISKRTCLENE